MTEPLSKAAIGRALGNQYAARAIAERRAFLAGEITALQKKLRYLRKALAQVDATIAVIAPSFNPASIKAKRPYKRVKLFQDGSLNRLIHDTLRRAGRPLTLAEIVSGIVKELRYGPEAEAVFHSRVRTNLFYLAKVRRTIVKDGERERATWRVSESQRGTTIPALHTGTTSSVPQEKRINR